jgi:hypothetical protein
LVAARATRTSDRQKCQHQEINGKYADEIFHDTKVR